MKIHLEVGYEIDLKINLITQPINQLFISDKGKIQDSINNKTKIEEEIIDITGNDQEISSKKILPENQYHFQKE